MTIFGFVLVPKQPYPGCLTGSEIRSARADNPFEYLSTQASACDGQHNGVQWAVRPGPAHTSAPSCSTTELDFDQCGSGGSIVGWKATKMACRKFEKDTRAEQLAVQLAVLDRMASTS